MPEKLAYRIGEAVEATGLSRTALYEEMAAGRLEFVKHGRSRLILASALDRFLGTLTADGRPAA